MGITLFVLCAMDFLISILAARWCRIDACSLHGVFVNRSVIGLDIDTESLEIASANADELEVIVLFHKYIAFFFLFDLKG